MLNMLQANLIKISKTDIYNSYFKTDIKFHIVLEAKKQEQQEILSKKQEKVGTKLNKRAQRALGRSTEEKVKGHSGANNREPQGHNLNNFGKGPFDDVIY